MKGTQLMQWVICAVVLSTSLKTVQGAPGGGQTYWIAPYGHDNRTADGSEKKPYQSVLYAANQRRGGNTYILKSGVYPYVTVSTWNQDQRHPGIDVSGTNQRPTIIKSEVLHGAIIDAEGWPGHAFSNFLQQGNAHYFVINGLDIRNGTLGGIFFQNSDHITVRNCWIHNIGQKVPGVGVGLYPGTDSIIEHNLVENIGCMLPNKRSYNPCDCPELREDEHHGNAIYTSGERVTIRQNVVRAVQQTGIQFYGGAAYVADGIVSDNLVYNCHIGLYFNPNPGSYGGCVFPGGNNLIINNTIINNTTGLAGGQFRHDVIVNNVIAGNTRHNVALPGVSCDTWVFDYNQMDVKPIFPRDPYCSSTQDCPSGCGKNPNDCQDPNRCHQYEICESNYGAHNILIAASPVIPYPMFGESPIDYFWLVGFEGAGQVESLVDLSSVDRRAEGLGLFAYPLVPYVPVTNMRH